MGRRIQERHEIVVHSDETTFVFRADGDQLQIRKEGPDGEQVCALTLSQPTELQDFFEGLRRVLSAPGLSAQPAQPPPSREARREEVIESARRRNPKAFAAWTRTEEDDVRRRHARGESLADIARAHHRSPHAIEMRLRRMGLLDEERENA
jgi:hypothetical protein